MGGERGHGGVKMETTVLEHTNINKNKKMMVCSGNSWQS